MKRSFRIVLPVLVAVAGCVAWPARAGAQEQDPEQLRQQAEQMLGRPISDQEILQRLRQSGLSPQEIRQRLQERGYSPSAAEPWLQVLEGRSSQVPEGTSAVPLLSVLAAQETGRRQVGAVQPPDRRLQMAVDTGPPVFGRQFFQRATSAFQPVTTGPVPPDYRVGPGDRLQLVITGAVEQAYTLQVSREGWIVIPDVGRVSVNGKNMEELRETLFQRLSQAYSGITRGPDATTHFDVTVTELRTNQVYVVGEVEQPAAYTVSSLATALTALYHAGGPTDNGSFRRVVVNRGGEVVTEIDLYDYMVRGDASEDVRLEQGDIVFVPPAARQVRIEGPVTRPAIYHLLPGETLADLLDYAGGVRPDAELRQVQIERILPPEERTPGHDRAVMDLPLEPSAEGEAGADVPLRNGDLITVYAVREETRNQVQVSGAVWRPGTYGAGEDTRLWDVIRKAGGLLPDAYEGRAQIQRLQPDQTRRLISVSLDRTAGGEPAENPRLEGMDQVILFPKRKLRDEQVVSVGGWVRRPGVYPYMEGMTVADLVLQAGGLRTGAYLGEAQVSRVVVAQSRQDTVTRTLSVALDTSLVFDQTTGRALETGRGADGGGGRNLPQAERFPLHNLDAVYVRRSPGFEPQQTVFVTGEVQFPGPYSIRTRNERITDLVRRAGGLTPEAYPAGLQLWRVAADQRGAGPAQDSLTAREIVQVGVGADTAVRDTARMRQGRTGEAGGAAARRLQPLGAMGSDTTARDSLDLARRQLLQRDRYRTRVGVDFLAARRRPGSPSNLLVEPGDSIHVPRYVPTVEVRGAVAVETQVIWKESAGLGYYITQAGGYLESADEDRTWVRYANGEVDTKGGGFLFFGGGVEDPDPGSTVTVPFKPPSEGGMNISQFVGIFTSVASAAATVIIAVSR